MFVIFYTKVQRLIIVSFSVYVSVIYDLIMTLNKTNMGHVTIIFGCILRGMGDLIREIKFKVKGYEQGLTK